jgi:hypothetical protein
MKKNAILLTLLILSATVFSQQTPSVQTNYLRKSKKQKTAAWVCLSSGFACSVIGFIIAINDAENEIGSVLVTGHSTKTSATGAILLGTGTASMIGSIPLFIAAHRNKKRA